MITRPLPKPQEDVLFFAMRYALGRRTAAPSIVVGEITRLWNYLRPATQEQMRQEIALAVSREKAGDACDVVEWGKVLKLPTIP